MHTTLLSVIFTIGAISLMDYQDNIPPHIIILYACNIEISIRYSGTIFPGSAPIIFTYFLSLSNGYHLQNVVYHHNSFKLSAMGKIASRKSSSRENDGRKLAISLSAPPLTTLPPASNYALVITTLISIFSRRIYFSFSIIVLSGRSFICVSNDFQCLLCYFLGILV